jgi:hypothetical protein
MPQIEKVARKYLCVRDPELMFPFEEREIGAPSPGEQAALEVCAACPSLRRCRRWALTASLSHGVVGGLTRAQRRGLVGAEATCRQRGRAEKREVLATVLAAQRDFRPAQEVDPEVVSALMDGLSVEASPWERAIAAVALVLRGLSKVEVQRNLDVHARQLLRWCDRYATGKPLVHPERVRINGGARRHSQTTGVAQ